MKLVLSEPKYFKDSISIISELVYETKIKINKTGMTIISMDSANVAMVVFKLLSSSFSEVDVDEEILLGVNLNNLKQILRRVENSDILILETDGSEAKLHITIKGKTTRKFAIPVIDVDERDQKEPSLDFTGDVSMPATLLKSAIEDANVVSDSLAFIINGGKFIVAADGDLNEVKVEISPDEDVKIENTSESEVRAKYSIEYLMKMISGSKLSDEVVLQFGVDYPIKMSFVSVDKLSLSFVLAPRVEND